MTGAVPAEPAAERDALLARLLEELSEQLQRGQQPDLDAVVQRHPSVADELRELWAAVQVAEALAVPASTPLTIDDPARPDAVCGGAGLPRLAGDYELLEELGRGGMGVVYRAWQKSLGRTVALKRLLRGELASAADVARFRAEAESAARLEHPHIVAIYEVGELEGLPYFSMQYVEGTTLAARLAEGPLPPHLAARYLALICRAVHHAHQRGMLHRDLKPSNILLDRDDQPHVTDFGLAKRVEGDVSLTGTGAIVGTPSYMAPEQAAGSRGTLSPASDVYSLGTILYQMLTGRPPFQGTTPADTLLLVLEQEPVPPRLLNPRVDRDLEMICLKCLQKPPELRYASAAELADDLEAFLAGEPVSARRSGLSYFLGRMLRPTHHAAVLENWGPLWMWHSLVTLVLASATNWIWLRGVRAPGPYLALWIVGLQIWASIFWYLRHRAGPVTFVERQIIHAWAGGTLGTMAVFLVELLLGLEVLTLAPMLAVLAAVVFLFKAGTLSGEFYYCAAAFFVCAALMALIPRYGLFLFGVVSAASFFFPGLKYYRQRRQALEQP